MLGPFSARDARTGQSVRVSVSPRSGLRLERRPVGDLGGDDSAPPAVENLSLLELAGWKCSPASPPDAAEPVVSLKLISGRLISLRCAAEAGRGLVQRLDAVTNQLAAAAAAQPAGDAWTAIRRHGPNHSGCLLSAQLRLQRRLMARNGGRRPGVVGLRRRRRCVTADSCSPCGSSSLPQL